MFNMLIYHHIPLLYLNFKYREFLFRQHHHDTTGGPSLRMPSRVPRVAERRVGAAGDAVLKTVHRKRGTWWGYKLWCFFLKIFPEDITLNSEISENQTSSRLLWPFPKVKRTLKPCQLPWLQAKMRNQEVPQSSAFFVRHASFHASHGVIPNMS